MFLLVGLGGAAGSVLRFGITNISGRYFSTPLPIATFGINVLGAFLIGLLFGYSLKGNNWLSQEMMLVLATGFCGGFTTFSTFALENINLFQKGNNMVAILYTVASVVCGLLLCKLGLWIVD